MFIDPGASVLTCRPTYRAPIQAWRAYQAHFVAPCSLDDDGMQVEVLEEIVSRLPVRFIYVLPNFHNPAGTSPNPVVGAFVWRLHATTIS